MWVSNHEAEIGESHTTSGLWTNFKFKAIWAFQALFAPDSVQVRFLSFMEGQTSVRRNLEACYSHI
jgi:hypothetical protein